MLATVDQRDWSGHRIEVRKSLCGYPHSKRAGKTREFITGRTIGNGAAGCGDVVGSSLGSGFFPLIAHLRYRQLLEVDFVYASGDRLRVLLTNLGDRDAAGLDGALNDRRTEVLELVKVRPLEIVEMKNGQLGVGEGVEDTFVVGARELFVVGDRTELAFGIKNADQRTR